jgi:hypothetical protein
MITTTRAHERAINEAEATISALDAAIADATEALAAARDEAGRLESAWDTCGTEMAEERTVAVDPFVGNEAAHRARERFHAAADRRLQLDEPRQAAAGRVTAGQKRQELLKRQREVWAERLAALEAGADPGDADGSGGSVAPPSES